MQIFGAVYAVLGPRGLEFALNWSAQNPKHDRHTHKTSTSKTPADMNSMNVHFCILRQDV
jgi:hypothetical protein